MSLCIILHICVACTPTTQYTVYPCGIDGSDQLPIVSDNITPVKGEVINRQRDSIIAIESELGIQPSGTFTTVRARLDAVDAELQTLIGGGGGLSMVLKDGTTVLTDVLSMNFTGSGVSLTTDPISGRINVNITTSAAPITIDSFSTSSSLVEVSQTVATPSFTASYSITPTTATLTDNAGTPSKDITSSPTSFSSAGTFVKNTFGATVVFTDTVMDADSNTDSSNTTITWGQKNYYGIGTAGQTGGTFILTLTATSVSTSRNASFTVDATTGNKIYYATRTAYGTPTFKDASTGFALDINNSGNYSLTNTYGFTENYQLWESSYAGLGSITVDVS